MQRFLAYGLLIPGIGMWRGVGSLRVYSFFFYFNVYSWVSFCFSCLLLPLPFLEAKKTI